MKSVRDVLERRYISRTLSARESAALSRAARHRGEDAAAAEHEVWKERHTSACAEIAKIGRDLGIDLDTYVLRRRAIEREAELEETLRRFEATRRKHYRHEA